MRAVWLTGYGDPAVLQVRDTDEPAAGPDEVVIDVAAVSISFIETMVRSGAMASRSGGLEPPYIPGNGVGGTVTAAGSDVDGAWIGRRVVSTTGGTGGYAERVVVPAAGLIPVPEGVSLTDATALLADGRTATGLIEVAAPRAGETVLIEAAAGGVGSLLVQLARAAGARVIAAAGGAAKTSLAAELGADATVDYTRPGWAGEVGPVDVVFDGVGGAVGAASLGALRPGGRFVLFGLASGRPTMVDRADVTLLGFEVLGQIGARAGEFTTRALAEAAAGRLRPVVGQTFPLAEAAAAHTAIETRATLGKTLLIP
jgi:NADPH2:quinone reductase